MPILAKNYYRTAKGDKRVNCYVANIPKEVVNKTDLENKQIKIYAQSNKIIIEENKNGN